MFIIISIIMLLAFIYSCCKITSISDYYIDKERKKEDEEDN